MYSAHDSTVANLLNTLKMFEIHSPPYAATILLEMRKHKKQPLISIFYKTTSDDPQPIEIPGCGIQCPLTKMYELYSDVIPEDWDSECNTHNYIASPLMGPEPTVLTKDSMDQDFLALVVIFIIPPFLILLTILIIVIVHICKNAPEYEAAEDIVKFLDQ